MNIRIICIGKLKESFIREAQQEYLKRLSKYCKIEIIELADEKIPAKAFEADEKCIKEKECAKILKEIEKISKPYVFAMDLKGKQLTSTEFAENIENVATYSSTANLVFIIGGSLGLTDEVLNKCNEKLAFSKLTFPHQLFRIFLLEQIFRAFKINNNEIYHK
ncbi:MAG: 23S rRNA (pseudouridine(1915)-N(3))-methyltransferase RlmH [Clostridia bacterium]